jgi:hypothetical protein
MRDGCADTLSDKADEPIKKRSAKRERKHYWQKRENTLYIYLSLTYCEVDSVTDEHGDEMRHNA